MQLFPWLHRGCNLCVSFEANIVAYFQHPVSINVEVTSIKLWILSLPKCGQKCIIGENMAVFGPNILIFRVGGKSFGTLISENYLCTLFRTVWSDMAPNGPEKPMDNSMLNLHDFSWPSQKRQGPLKCPEMYPEPTMASEMGEGDQIWLKCITGDLSMIIR